MIYPSDVSPDGAVLLYTRATGLSTDLWYVPLGADRTPHPFVATQPIERDGQFSPDGKWVAYQSNEAGHSEIYLQPFPGPGARIQVSAGGGQHVRWARTGSEEGQGRGDCYRRRGSRRRRGRGHPQAVERTSREPNVPALELNRRMVEIAPALVRRLTIGFKGARFVAECQGTIARSSHCWFAPSCGVY